MAITIDWGNKVINVPKADMLLVQSVPFEVRALDIDAFRLVLNDLQDDPVGMPYPTTHAHVSPVSVGGVQLARVVEIINGYTITFEDGQYAVNLIGANSNIGDVVNLNQVSVRSANSVGLSFSDIINDQSYQGYVWIDTVDGLSGTQYPRGTPSDPVSNWTDAVIIAESRKFESFKLRHALVLPNAAVLDQYTISGLNLIGSVLTFDGNSVVDTEVTGVTFSGSLGTGHLVARQCNVQALTNFEGSAYDCRIDGNIQLKATPYDSLNVSFINCVSGFAGDARFTLDCNGTTSNIQFRNWTGGIGITNFTGGNSMSIDVSQGKVVIDSTCTAGTILVRGVAEVVDNSGVGCTVILDGTVTNLAAAGSITEADKADIANRIIPQIWAAS